ncbi:preprotein translocase subunit SecG [Sagittula salina]|uniref:Protein-export membrane protein SecG n=1 Tax=Sagittula salina TaxID=2820268 RepID=A0A940S237_9RHOB|nr:preprotein translocase subunit SecG [Sagittula salina]MBP0481220.1 preprotein translocase subunit SecG [Sagittula salina]
MQNVVLIIHLLLALGLIGVVLLQRNEGGGLGMGSGGGPAGARAQTTPLAKVTWVLAAGFIITSITLTIFAAENAAGTSILDRLSPSAEPASDAAPTTPGTELNVDDLLPPPAADGSSAPLTPKAD